MKAWHAPQYPCASSSGWYEVLEQTGQVKGMTASVAAIRRGCWRAADWLAHLLYCPAMLGRRAARWRPAHEVHLLPCRALSWVCQRTDRASGRR